MNEPLRLSDSDITDLLRGRSAGPVPDGLASAIRESLASERARNPARTTGRSAKRPLMLLAAAALLLGGGALAAGSGAMRLWSITPPDAATSGGMWPQSTLDEVRAAQERADAGDPDYTWQVEPNLDQEPSRAWMHIVEAQPAVPDRFLRGVLGWDEYIVNVFPGPTDSTERAGGVYRTIGYLRCAPSAEQSLPVTCNPTRDDQRYETVSINIAQLDRRGPDGIWVVSDWKMTEPYTPVEEVTALIERILQARIDGRGAEDLVYNASNSPAVPLLYATTTGAPYERYELQQVRGPGWGGMGFKVRLFADGGQTVVEQDMDWVYWSPAAPTLWGELTTENGQPVIVRHEFLDGMVTAYAKPANTSCGGDCLAVPGPGAGYVSLAAVDPTEASECLDDAADPVSVTIDGVAALATDGSGRLECELFDDWYGGGRRVRLYLVDPPRAWSMPTIAIAVIADGVPFDDVIAAATPIIESIRFDSFAGKIVPDAEP